MLFQGFKRRFTVLAALLLGAWPAVAQLPPSITVSPTNRTVLAGTNVTFTVSAAGTAPLAYQWRFSAADLAGRISTSLSLTNVQAVNTGDYDVVVTNLYGAITSAVATLTVTPAPPTFVTQPVSIVVSYGGVATWTAAGRGTEPMTCQWQREGTNLPGETAFTLAVSNLNHSFSGAYRAVLSNEAGVTFSTNATLVVTPVVGWGTAYSGSSGWKAFPPSLTNIISIATGQGEHSQPCLALRNEGRLVAWGANIPAGGAPPSNFSNVVAFAHVSSGAGDGTKGLALRADGSILEWSYGAAVPTPTVLTNNDAVAVAVAWETRAAIRSDGRIIVWGSYYAPTNVPAGVSNVVDIAVTSRRVVALKADGTTISWGTDYCGEQDPLNGIGNLTGVFVASCQTLGLRSDGSVVGSVSDPSTGTYGSPPPATNLSGVSLASLYMMGLRRDGTVEIWPQRYGYSSPWLTNIPSCVSNVIGISAINKFALALVADPTAPPIPPRVGRPPLGRTITAGQTAVFNTLSIGGGPLGYQWYRNGVLVPGQNRSSLIFLPALPTDAGDYQLVVTNQFGAATSAVATVSVSIPRPVLTSANTGGGSFQLNFTSIPGVAYRIERTDSLNPPDWVELEQRIGIGGVEAVTDPAPLDDSRFYRIKVQ